MYAYDAMNLSDPFQLAQIWPNRVFEEFQIDFLMYVLFLVKSTI